MKNQLNENCTGRLLSIKALNIPLACAGVGVFLEEEREIPLLNSPFQFAAQPIQRVEDPAKQNRSKTYLQLVLS